VASLLNPHRPPVFCPGCSHERSLHALDAAFRNLGCKAEDVVIVSDIGCSGLFDVFFATHALHGLHGRALTYATGIKLAQPHLQVVAVMGDGGLGIGGAHLLAACRRNLDITLLILNNFNFGMTGGQFSCTTPSDAAVASGFLNALEKPMDACSVAVAGGAPFVLRCTVHQHDLAAKIQEAISFRGFSVVDIWGGCPGRFLKRNLLTPQRLAECAREMPTPGVVPANVRQEYGAGYRERCGSQPFVLEWQSVAPSFVPVLDARREVVLLGSAGQRVISAATLLATAAMLSGLHVTQKNDYDITVMRGLSMSELILSPQPISFTGMEQPDVLLAISEEGVTRRSDLFAQMRPGGLVIHDRDIAIPETPVKILNIDFKGHGIKKTERALASVAIVASLRNLITPEMLTGAIHRTFAGRVLESSLSLIEKAMALPGAARV
jgi:pyruvate/2-oxoacid:ferredoxin oxidoreductase beta subunit/Pyruvate/2-oxoacid:ferredoxin oxidoreductase gamma subunit